MGMGKMLLRWSVLVGMLALLPHFAEPLVMPGLPVPGWRTKGAQMSIQPWCHRPMPSQGGRNGCLSFKQTSPRSTICSARISDVEVDDVPADIEDLIASGTVTVWRKVDSPPEALSGGARGAGHNETSSRDHVEPDIIYVVGTSHVSRQSAVDVERVIAAVKPDNVVVELCRSRAGIMYSEDVAGGQPSMLSLNGASFLQAFARSLSLGGGTAFLLRALLARSPALSEVVGVVGRDFRAARIAGEAIGAQIVLGDRPVEITLERSWRSLSGEEKRRAAQALAGAVFAGRNATQQEELRLQSKQMEERVGDGSGQGLVDSYEAQLAELFPGVIEPLIKERDIFLSLTMKSSMAVNGCKKVVGVVGVGHQSGVMKCLNENHSGKFRELTWTPSRAAIKDKVFGVPRSLIKRLAFDTVLTVFVYFGYTWLFPGDAGSPL